VIFLFFLSVSCQWRTILLLFHTSVCGIFFNWASFFSFTLFLRILVMRGTWCYPLFFSKILTFKIFQRLYSFFHVFLASLSLSWPTFVFFITAQSSSFAFLDLPHAFLAFMVSPGSSFLSPFFSVLFRLDFES